MATVNRAGTDWLILKRWAQDKIEEQTKALIENNENGDIRRGQIMAMRSMIETVEPDALPEVEDVSYER